MVSSRDDVGEHDCDDGCEDGDNGGRRDAVVAVSGVVGSSKKMQYTMK